MSATELLQTIAGGIAGLVAVIMSIIQFLPCKSKPWTYILKKLGKAMNEEMDKKVENLGKELKDLRISCDEKAMHDRRNRILRFNDEILHKQRHSKEHFDQILIDISDYELYCDNHEDFKNNVANLAITNVKTTYAKCLAENSFL